MNWWATTQGDPRCTRLMDRHYSRAPHRLGTVHFMPPGPSFVLVTGDGLALWGTSAPQFVSKQSWAGANGHPLAWVCSVFRNEGRLLSSALITEALAVTRHVYGDPPPGGMLTFVDPVATRRRRGKRNPPGWCFINAGFARVLPDTKPGQIVLHLPSHLMPDPRAPLAVVQTPLDLRGAA